MNRNRVIFIVIVLLIFFGITGIGRTEKKEDSNNKTTSSKVDRGTAISKVEDECLDAKYYPEGWHAMYDIATYVDLKSTFDYGGYDKDGNLLIGTTYPAKNPDGERANVFCVGSTDGKTTTIWRLRPMGEDKAFYGTLDESFVYNEDGTPME